MEQFSNPDLINSLGLGDKLLNSLLVMVLGMGITFIVLIGLMVFIALLKSFSGHKKEVKKESIIQPEPVKVVEKKALSLPKDDDELLAVIAAAIQAQDDELVAVIASVIAMLDQTSPLKIQSIKRINPPMPAWAQSGLNRNLRRI